MSELEPMRIQPTTTEVSAPYWDGCRRGELRLQRCTRCERFQFYPRIICSHCESDALECRFFVGFASC